MGDVYKDELREDSYDGIQEYDNQLPRWWVWKFIISIIFAVAYLLWYHFSQAGDSIEESYRKDYASFRAEELLRQQQQKPLTEVELTAFLADPDMVAKGKEIFDTRCMSCHGTQGEGIVGPNLTDQYWIHGNKLTQIVAIIEDGVPEKGMVPWKGILQQSEIHAAAAFVKSLEGRSPSNPKPPEGELITD